jgi:hypothetical protein
MYCSAPSPCRQQRWNVRGLTSGLPSFPSFIFRTLLGMGARGMVRRGGELRFRFLECGACFPKGHGSEDGPLSAEGVDMAFTTARMASRWVSESPSAQAANVRTFLLPRATANSI